MDRGLFLVFGLREEEKRGEPRRLSRSSVFFEFDQSTFPHLRQFVPLFHPFQSRTSMLMMPPGLSSVRLMCFLLCWSGNWVCRKEKGEFLQSPLSL